MKAERNERSKVPIIPDFPILYKDESGRYTKCRKILRAWDGG